MRLHARIKVAAAIISAALTIAGCGSSTPAAAPSSSSVGGSPSSASGNDTSSNSSVGGSSSSASGSAASSNSSVGGSPSSASGSATGAEIVIGNVGTYSGLTSTIGPTRKLIEAWAADVNAAGGLGGHPVRLIVKDDTASPTTAIAAVKQLVEDEHVVAIVSDMSIIDQSWYKYISTTSVPVIGGQPFQPGMSTNASFFPSGGSGISRIYGELEQAKKLGSKFGQLYCAEAPACATDGKLFKFFASDLGMEVPVSQSITASQPNFTAGCQALIDSGVQSYQIGHAADVALRVMDACYQQGLKARQISTGGIPATNWLTHPSAEGTINIGENFPYQDTSTPGTKAYSEMVAKHNLGAVLQSDTGTYAWAGLKLFEAAVKGVGSGEVTSESLKTALYAMKGETLDGVAPPLTFKQNAHTSINCWVVSEIKNGKWVTPNGLKYDCAPDDRVAAAAAAVFGTS